MKPVILTLISILIFAAPALAGSSGVVDEWSIQFPSFKYFNWEESDAGARILREEGLLVGAGGMVSLNLYNRRLLLRIRGEMFGGDVHYNGHTQPDPNPIFSNRPVKTDVIYFGTKVDNDLGWRFPAGSGSIEPFAGIGYRWWLRSLQDSVTEDANGNTLQVGGANELWQSVYTRVGSRATWSFTKDFAIFAEGGGKYPFYNQNRADSPNGGTVTVKPGSEWSGFAELGLKYKRFMPTVYYEGFRFSRSDIVPINNNVGIFQPKSDSDIFGFNLNWVF